MATVVHEVTPLKQAIDRVLGIVVRKVALDIHANLVAPPIQGGTPVDTGWARSNWIPRVGEPQLEPVGSRPTGKEENLPVTRGATGRPRYSLVDFGPQIDGREQVTGYKIDVEAGAQHVFVSNNVPYIGDLNDGSSKQAPAGFVERAIVKALREDLRHDPGGESPSVGASEGPVL